MFENFKRRWELIISKIENVAIDDLGVELIQLNFRCNRDLLVASMKVKNHRVINELEVLRAELEAALQIAHSRFRLKNRGILAGIFGGMFKRHHSHCMLKRLNPKDILADEMPM